MPGWGSRGGDRESQGVRGTKRWRGLSHLLPGCLAEIRGCGAHAC